MKVRHICFPLLAMLGLTNGCGDSGTNGFILTPETTEELCSDGIDNNLNGLIDCAEESCKQFEHCKGDETDKKEICDNQADDDGDGKADCEDEDCASAANCQSSDEPKEICDNSTDDDGDNKADCDDEDCASAANCQGSDEPKEICDNTTDDDGDGKADCDDEDCASAANCQKTKEICDNTVDDDGDGKIDCDDPDCASASNCQKPKEICDNSADDDGDGKTDCADEDCASATNCQKPKEICDNEKDDDDDDKIDCEDPDCSSAAACAPKELKNLKFKVGLVSDIHFDSTDRHKAEHIDDLINAVTYYKENDVKFIASCGDIAEYEPEDYESFHEYYNAHAYAPTYGKLRLFNVIGNHDFLQLYTIQDPSYQFLESWLGSTASNYHAFAGEDDPQNVGPDGKKDMKFFEFNGAWDEQYTEGRVTLSKVHYYIEKENNMFVFLSVDYGLEPHKANAHATNMLDMDNKYVKQMKAYVADTSYDEAKEKDLNYQYYHPNTLIWLKDIIENNPNKHIFVFTHHFITHKAGNGVPFNDKVYYSAKSVWPYTTDQAVMDAGYFGSNSLSGLTFHFINKLNNTHKNVIWFSGHTHYQWEDAEYDDCLDFCNKEFDFVQPAGNEASLAGSFNSSTDLKLYTRVNNHPKGLSAYNVHIPSLSKPTDMGTGNYLYKASQGGIMEVYENGVRIKGLSFKKENSESYENNVVVTKDIFFP